MSLKKKLQFTYLIIYDTFAFKVWFENNLNRSIMKVPYCVIGFCKESNDTGRNRFQGFILTKRNKQKQGFK